MNWNGRTKSQQFRTIDDAKPARAHARAAPNRINAANAVHAAVLALAFALTLSLILAGCAADYTDINKLKAKALGKLSAQAQLEDGVQNTKIRLHHTDFYTITGPNAYNCAGDIKRFYDSLEGNALAPTQLAADLVDSSSTIKPSFLKNVSTDITDSNSGVVGNLAYSCSYGDGLGVTPASNCASFDFGAIGGIPTSLGGTLLIQGGIRDLNYANTEDGTNGQISTVACGPLIPQSQITGADEETGVNACPTDFYALGVEVLPPTAAGTSLAPGVSAPNSNPISSWLKMDSSSTTPQGGTGGAMVYSQQTAQAMLFGGSAPITSSSFTDPQYDTRDTWVFDMKTQTWIKIATQSTSAANVTTMKDCGKSTTANCGSTTALLDVSKDVGGRAVFGYVASPNVSLQSMTSDGTVLAAHIDRTQRILVAGGLRGIDVSNSAIYHDDIHKFNPTYGPEFVDVEDQAAAAASDLVTQWMDSYHTQLMNGRNTFNPTTVCTNAENKRVLAHKAIGTAPVGSTDCSYTNGNVFNFGSAFTRTFASALAPGSMLVLGGFSSASTTGAAGAANGGNMQWFERLYTTDPLDITPSNTSNFSVIPTFNFDDNSGGASSLVQGQELSPGLWKQLGEGGGNTIPDWGGNSIVPGFDLTTNEYAIFGGTNCKKYLVPTSGGICPGTGSTTVTFNSVDLYWDLGTSVPDSAGAGLGNGLATITATAIAAAPPPPQKAGIATARGLDGGNNAILLAWGGTNDVNLSNVTDPAIYYLYNNAGTPTWAQVTPNAPRPTPVVNGTMVFSHVTKKFYLFGGLRTSPTIANSSETWELSVSGTCTSSGTCTFTWKQLDGTAGLTCYPSCPASRRSHGMVEVNYNDQNSGQSEYTSCDQNDGCSFGIFMEGGTQDGISVLSDRWMLDPTANGGRGHWQKMEDLPPRRLHAMTTLSYFVPSLNRSVHRTLIFGGETGLHSPGQTSATGQVFVAPTLGDTHMFDHETQTWTRVQLLGMGVHDDGIDYDFSGDTRSHREVRQTYLVNDTDTNRTTLRQLSPPPLAGHTMVTRTFGSASSSSTSAVEPLAIPEVWLVGGRKKDGSYAKLNEVWKFCSGSTGEDYGEVFTLDSTSGTYVVSSQDYTTSKGVCDAYGTTSNPTSTSPSRTAEGRWLRKVPLNSSLAAIQTDFSLVAADAVDPSATYSYLGAATYNPVEDRMILVGGLSPGAVNELITSSTARTITGYSGGKFNVLEYTPPSQSIIPQGTGGSGGTPDNVGLDDGDRSLLHGIWTQAQPCFSTSQPTARYGHALAYDTLNQQLILVGGYDVNDSDLTYTHIYNTTSGGSVDTADVWAAKRYRTASVSGTDATTSYCYGWHPITTYGNLVDTDDLVMPDHGLSHMAYAFVPSTGYNTGYYSVFDEACVNAGPIASNDPSVSKLLAGGVDIDLDRDKLGPNENILLQLTLMPLGDQNRSPDSTMFDEAEESAFRIHLMSTGKDEEILKQVYQPRYLTYTDDQAYPKLIDTLSVVSVPTGKIRQEQVLIPLSAFPEVDRIRIERYSGSAILLETTLHKMGYR